jgi:hypothetical protein
VLSDMAAVGATEARQEGLPEAGPAALAEQLHGTCAGLLAVLHTEKAGEGT